MKKNSMTGWKDVFTFSLVQTLKNKAYIVSLLLFIGMAIVSMPLVNMIKGDGGDSNQPNPIQKVYVLNQTSLPDMNFAESLSEENLSHISYINTNDPVVSYITADHSIDRIIEWIDTEEKDSVLMVITDEGMGYSLSYTMASNGPVSKSALQQLGNAISEAFPVIKLKSMGVTEEQAKLLDAKVITSSSYANASGEAVMKEDTSISGAEYWFLYGVLIIVMMVSTMSGSVIASAIVTEKSTRVVEYLLISIRPLALMVGKVLSMLVSVVIQIGSMMITVFISNKITAYISPGANPMAEYLPKNIFSNLNPLNILLCLIMIVLGLVFYGILAGLAGATVSRLEEIQEGLTLFTITNIGGLYLALGSASALMGAGMNAFVLFTFLFPLSSPFILPGAILIGKASLGMAVGAIALQLVFTLLLFMFVAKVYETLILHNGNTIKPKELFKLSKNV